MSMAFFFATLSTFFDFWACPFTFRFACCTFSFLMTLQDLMMSVMASSSSTSLHCWIASFRNAAHRLTFPCPWSEMKWRTGVERRISYGVRRDNSMVETIARRHVKGSVRGRGRPVGLGKRSRHNRPREVESFRRQTHLNAFSHLLGVSQVILQILQHDPVPARHDLPRPSRYSALRSIVHPPEQVVCHGHRVRLLPLPLLLPPLLGGHVRLHLRLHLHGLSRELQLLLRGGVGRLLPREGGSLGLQLDLARPFVGLLLLERQVLVLVVEGRGGGGGRVVDLRQAEASVQLVVVVAFVPFVVAVVPGVRHG
mmetsp:Transcript_45725/g.97212  ORF Transcript_45725/g.97212 Transcript_45725/m.97212 type:complete len:311 (+) Transcript_45725:269-1201(+)